MLFRRFSNSQGQKSRPLLRKFLLWNGGYYRDPSFDYVPKDFIYPAVPKESQQDKPLILSIGHCTFLIQWNGLVFLTDPIWSDYCFFVPIKALKRMIPPPISIENLPPIDFVLISHNHYDHLDLKTVLLLNKLQPQIQWIVPENLSKWFQKKGVDSADEIGWWKSLAIKNTKITAVPSQHYSGRHFFDYNKTHWNGYVVEYEGKKLYFAGDTAYNPYDFKKIGERFKKMDISLIPIGTYVPNQIMATCHLSPYKAVQIHQEVGSMLSVGMHWNTFALSAEPKGRPPYDLYLAMKEKNLPFESFFPIDVGTYVNF